MINRKKILVIDDDDAIVDLLHAKLGDRYDVISTNAPENVLALVRNHAPDLVICDIDMPEMDGGDVSAALYADAETRGIPLLFLTSLVTPADAKAARGQIGGRVALSKHAPVAELLARIQSMIDR